MSGPVTASDLPATAESCEPGTETLEVIAPRDAVVGTVPVRRSLPRRERRTVGAWCFLDQMGPVTVTAEQGMDVAPHPHIGLHTVTWLLSGEVVHRDSLGSEQLIRPGELNLMTAGRGVSHSEERSDKTDGELQGVQLWIPTAGDPDRSTGVRAPHGTADRRDRLGGSDRPRRGAGDAQLSCTPRHRPDRCRHPDVARRRHAAAPAWLGARVGGDRGWRHGRGPVRCGR